MKNFLTLLKMEFILTKRNISNFTMGLGFPVIFFILFSGMQQFDDPSVQTRVIKDMLISMTAFSSISFALFSLPLSIREDETNSYLSIINNSPIKLVEYYFARFTRLLVTFIIAVIVVFTVGHFLRDVNMSAKEWIMAGILMVIGSTTFLGIGLILSLIQSTEKLSLLSNILYLGLAMLGGLWWPTYLFPEWLQNISKVTPTYHLLNFVNKYIKEDIFSFNSLGILLAYGIGFIILTLVIKRKMEIK
ncbi:ABC-2 type transporter [Gemella bergeri ATCC 700627]|uniref:ABC-2 type transporter n=1 Tax=Gemella bergeri ATCC 700627 TaxID=1321820 RepID=U2QN83_9BACL|nr:ABC transporter permease [Gemella bergeri]ERK57664.1 ABC-2 type transporter [Gemella bergeri ATCC 700627]